MPLGNRLPAAVRHQETYWFVTGSTAAAIAHVGGASDTYLTNNALGDDTGAYNPNGKDVIWDAVANAYDCTSLKIGDVINLTGRATFDNLAAQGLDMFIEVAGGTTSEHEHQINHTYYKTAASGTGFTFHYLFVIQTADERDGTVKFRFESPQNAAITVDNWTAIIDSV
jgi:hypothetical protein